MKFSSRAFALVATFGLVACQPAVDTAEIEKQLKDIQDKVTSIEKKIDSMPTRAAAGPAREDPNKVYTIPIGNAPIKGNPKASVTIVEYSDFQCPFCARVQPLLTQVLEKYPDDVRLVFKHFPLSFHKAARPAAIASQAAQEQGKFWEMHDLLFEVGNKLDAAKMDEYAAQAGLDVEKFNADYKAKQAEYGKAVAADMALGQKVAVRGTPTLFINGKKVQQRSLEGMSAMIDSELEKKKGS
jgi:protein-disulfide isomerase